MSFSKQLPLYLLTFVTKISQLPCFHL